MLLNPVEIVGLFVTIGGLALLCAGLAFSAHAYRAECETVIATAIAMSVNMDRSAECLRIMTRNSEKLANRIRILGADLPMLEEIPAAFFPAEDEPEFMHIVDELRGKKGGVE